MSLDLSYIREREYTVFQELQNKGIRDRIAAAALVKRPELKSTPKNTKAVKEIFAVSGVKKDSQVSLLDSLGDSTSTHQTDVKKTSDVKIPLKDWGAPHVRPTDGTDCSGVDRKSNNAEGYQLL